MLKYIKQIRKIKCDNICLVKPLLTNKSIFSFNINNYNKPLL